MTADISHMDSLAHNFSSHLWSAIGYYIHYTPPKKNKKEEMGGRERERREER